MRSGAQTPRLNMLFDRRSNPWSVALEAERHDSLPPPEPEHRPPADVVETTHAVVVVIDLPGVDRESMEVRVAGRWLHVRAKRTPHGPHPAKVHCTERGCGGYERTIEIPAAVDAEFMSVQCVAGVVSIALPKVF